MTNSMISQLAAILFVILMISAIPLASAVSVEVETDKSVYYFGEYLSFTIKVSEVTGDNAELVIKDSEGMKSTPIPIGINKHATTITAPQPFESIIYKEGKYTLELEYAEEKAITEFSLEDSGKVVIPSWIKDLTAWWIQGQIDDTTYSKGLEYLINNDIIKIPGTNSTEAAEEVTIPLWVKTNADWWIEDLITDGEFARGIQHLIKIGVIVV